MKKGRCELLAIAITFTLFFILTIGTSFISATLYNNCTKDSDCGNNGFTGNTFCNENNGLIRNYVNYTCINPGSNESYCNITLSYNLFYQNCSFNQLCSIGSCFNVTCFNDTWCDDKNDHTEDYCNEPGKLNASCSYANIRCLNNLECGSDGYLGSKFCNGNDVNWLYNTYTCINPGKSTSKCSNLSVSQKLWSCLPNQLCDAGKCINISCISDQSCDDSNPYTEDHCHSPKTFESKCIHLNITCLSDSDIKCDDNDYRTEDHCINAKTTESYCNHLTIDCFNNSECGKDGYFGDKFCGKNNVNWLYNTYTCNNPGTAKSSCSNKTEMQIWSTCSSRQLCSFGECKNITCFNDLECDDNNNYTKDKCLNPGQINSTCQYKNITCFTNADCGNDGLLENKFCNEKNVFDTSIKFTCVNSGKTWSKCTNVTSQVLIDKCGYDCYDSKCIDDPNQLIIFNPKSNNYNISSIPVSLKTGNLSQDKIEYRDNSGNKEWKTLCNDCSSFGIENNKAINLKDGEHMLLFRATKGSKVQLENVSLFVDKTKPKINNISPKGNTFSNGSNFFISYNEDNVLDITLFLDDLNISKNCPSGYNKNCLFQFNLENTSGKNMHYYFIVTDTSGNKAISRDLKIYLDNVYPIINNTDLITQQSNNPGYVTFNLEIIEKNLALVRYIDSFNGLDARWTTICTKLNNDNKCVSKKYFKKGEHNVLIEVIDKSGNSIKQNINFTI